MAERKQLIIKHPPDLESLILSYSTRDEDKTQTGYFAYNPDKTLTEESKKKLRAFIAQDYELNFQRDVPDEVKQNISEIEKQIKKEVEGNKLT